MSSPPMSPPSHLLERLLVPIAIGVGAACAPDSPDFDAESDASAGAGGSAGVDGGDAGLDSGGNGGAGGASGSSGSWGRKLGGPGAARVTDIELDAAGAVYLTGYFDQSIDLGSGNQASTGDEDAFLASYDPDGELAWPPRVIGSTKQDRGWEVEVDEAGNLLAAGEFQLSVNFGAETLTAVTTGTVDTKDAWLAVYSASSGASLGAQHVGTGPCHAEANGLAHGATETVVTVTYSDCSGMVVGRDNVSSSGLFDFALVDVSAGLALGPPQSVGTSNSEHASHITIGPGGDRFVAGYYRGAADYGKGPLPDTGATGQHHNALVMRLTREGTVVWAQGFASIDADDFSSVVVVGDVVYAAGHAGGVVPLADGGPSAYAGGFDGLLVALDAATGAVRWVKLLSGGGQRRAHGDDGRQPGHLCGRRERRSVLRRPARRRAGRVPGAHLRPAHVGRTAPRSVDPGSYRPGLRRPRPRRPRPPRDRRNLHRRVPSADRRSLRGPRGRRVRAQHRGAVVMTAGVDRHHARSVFFAAVLCACAPDEPSFGNRGSEDSGAQDAAADTSSDGPEMDVCSPSGSWLEGWQHCRTVSLTGTVPAGYTHRLELSDSFVAGRSRADLGDLRFHEGPCGSTLSQRLSHWVEQVVPNGEHTIWVRTETEGLSSVALYYGSAPAPDLSDATSTFELFDDFDGDELDPSLWEAPSISGNCVPAQVASIGGKLIMSGQASSPSTCDVDLLSVDGFTCGDIGAAVEFRGVRHPDWGGVGPPGFYRSAVEGFGVPGIFSLAVRADETGLHLDVCDPSCVRGMDSGRNPTSAFNLELTCHDSQAEWAVNGATEYSVTATFPPPGILPIWLHLGSWDPQFVSSTSTEVDAIRVRRFVRPEPALSVGPELTSSSVEPCP